MEITEKESLNNETTETCCAENRIMRAVCGDNESGLRLDRFIADSFAEISRSYAETLIGDGAVAVNGRTVTKKNIKLATGDEVTVALPEPAVLDIEPENIPLDIVYEDDDVMVINKPRGMVVHPGPGNYSGTLVNAIMYHSGDSLSSINGVARPGIVHRIDKDTSGLIMVAKNDAAHEALASQLEAHTVTREYWALCCDNIRQDELTVDAPIGRDPRNRLRRAVYHAGIYKAADELPDGAKRAVTHVRVLERFGVCTLVSCRLETGRTHQIRVHMAYIKHPLVGDRLYGSKKQPVRLTGIPGLEEPDDGAGTGGQILHAKVLGFVHPRTGEYMEFDSGLPPYFSALLDRCRQQ